MIAQVVDGGSEDVRHAGQRWNIRLGLATFPLAYGNGGYAKAAAQLLLGESDGQAEGSDPFCVHAYHLTFII